MLGKDGFFHVFLFFFAGFDGFFCPVMCLYVFVDLVLDLFFIDLIDV